MKIKRNRENQDIPLASMSDIAFLLIIFFVITMSFIYKKGLQVILPKKESTPVIVNIENVLLLKLDESGNLFLSDKKIEEENLNIGKENSAIIKVHKKCPYKYLVKLIDILQRKGIYKLSIKSL